MHTSAVFALAFVVAAGPALGAPPTFGRRQATSSSAIAPSTTSSAPQLTFTDTSGAIDTQLISDIVDIGNGIITGAEGLKQIITSVSI